MRNKFIKGWPRHEQGERAYVVSLAEALERDFTTDAHFAAYRSPNRRRLTREALDQVAVEMTAVVFDVDCPDTHGTSEPAPEDWRRELRLRVIALDRVHPGPYYYETKGGGRIVYRPATPTMLRSQDDAIRWAQDYAIAVQYLRRFGIEADPACADWQRLFRLPRATRDKAEAPENWPTWGIAEDIGAFLFEPTQAEFDAARSTKAFDRKKIRELGPHTGSGAGLFYELLHARGDIERELEPGVFVIRCPNEQAHTAGATGDTSTVLYGPAAGKEVGCIHCKHAHCVDLRVRDWLRFFSDSELEAARQAAGIERAA